MSGECRRVTRRLTSTENYPSCVQEDVKLMFSIRRVTFMARVKDLIGMPIDRTWEIKLAGETLSASRQRQLPLILSAL